MQTSGHQTTSRRSAKVVVLYLFSGGDFLKNDIKFVYLYTKTKIEHKVVLVILASNVINEMKFCKSDKRFPLAF